MKKEGSIAEACLDYLRTLLNITSMLYVVLMAVILPLYFDIETGYQKIGSNKAELFGTWGLKIARFFVVVLIFYIFFAIWEFLRRHKGEKGKLSILINDFLDDLSLTDKFAIFFLVILCISYYYTDFPESLRMGMLGWQMGFVPMLIYLGAYFALSRLLGKKRIVMILAGMVAPSVIVFLLGILNRYGVNPLKMEVINNHFISTIGNINWYCGYWSVIFPIGAVLFVFCEKMWLRILSGIFVAVAYTTAVTQGSDGGVLCLVVTTLLIGFFASKNRMHILRYLKMLLIYCEMNLVLCMVECLFPKRNSYITATYELLTNTAAPYIVAGVILVAYLLLLRAKNNPQLPAVYGKVLRGTLYLFGAAVLIVSVLIVVNTKNPGSIGALSELSLFIFDTEWASTRGATWTFGVQTWTSQNLLHKLIGVGPDGMAAYIYNGRDGQLLADVREVFGGSRLTNAHNEWITVLANLGVFGLIGFAGMMVSAIVRYIKAGRERVLCMVCGISLFAYTIHNIFSFQQIMNLPLMFIMMGVGEYLLRRREDV